MAPQITARSQTVSGVSTLSSAGGGRAVSVRCVWAPRPQKSEMTMPPTRKAPSCSGRFSDRRSGWTQGDATAIAQAMAVADPAPLPQSTADTTVAGKAIANGSSLPIKG